MTVRELTIGEYLLRVKQLGLSLQDLEEISEGDVYDMLIEEGNDHEEYNYKATQEDMDRFRG